MVGEVQLWTLKVSGHQWMSVKVSGGQLWSVKVSGCQWWSVDVSAEMSQSSIQQSKTASAKSQPNMTHSPSQLHIAFL